MFCHPWVNAFCNPMPTCNLLTMAIHKLHARFIGKYLIPYSCKMFNNYMQFFTLWIYSSTQSEKTNYISLVTKRLTFGHLQQNHLTLQLVQWVIKLQFLLHYFQLQHFHFFFVPFQDTFVHLVYFVCIPLLPLLMRNGFPLSFSILSLADFPFPHLSQRITLMIPFDPQLAHPQMIMMILLYSLHV